MDRRRLLALIAGFVIVVGSATLFVIRPWDQPAQQVLSADQPLTYTDSITGAAVSSLPQESGSASGQIVPPRMDIAGMGALDTYLTDGQAQSVEQTLKNFLAARSGLSDVNTGILNQQISQSNNNLLFTLVVDRPQATYHVTIDISDSQNPKVTWERIE